ncbi:MAG: hypothetical protein ACXVBW_11775, partial [Bdellovibrionota bacterium]
SRPENIVMQPHGLLRISDANEVGYIDSQNCVVATMAAQFNSGGDYFLNIDERLFNHPKHSALSKAVLLLHEYLYSQARIAGQGDSRNTRILVGRLITRNSLTVGSLIRELMDLGFDHGGYMDTYAYQVLTRIGARLLDQARSDVLDFNIRNKPHAIWMLGVFSCEPWISDFQAGRASITLLATMDEGNSKCTVATRKYGWSAVTRRQDAVLESLKSKYVSWSNLQPLLYGIPGLSDQTKNAVNDQVYGYMEVIGDSLRVNYPHDFTQTPEKDNVWNFLDAVIQSTTKCSPQDKICPQSVGEFAHSVDFDQVAIP